MRLAVDAGGQVGAGDGDGGVHLELQLRSHEDRLQGGGSFRVADQQVGGAERIAVHGADIGMPRWK